MKYLVLLCLPLMAFAQAPPETVDQLQPYLTQLMLALVGGDYKIVAGVVLMAAMVVIRQFVLPTAKINREHLPFIVAAIAGLSFGGMGMLSPEVGMVQAVKEGMITAFVAGGIWDLLGKYLAKLLLGTAFKKPLDKKA